MKKHLLAALAILAAGCASTADDGTLVGRVRFIDTNGQPHGDASLFSVAEGIRIVANVPGVAAGAHGFHVHAVGSCQAPTFETAGPHFNPTNRQHGSQNPNGPHAGDLPNFEGGGATVNLVAANLQVTGPNSVFDTDGSALVLHANADDLRTDPSGNSGARILCGVIERP